MRSHLGKPARLTGPAHFRMKSTLDCTDVHSLLQKFCSCGGKWNVVADLIHFSSQNLYISIIKRISSKSLNDNCLLLEIIPRHLPWSLSIFLLLERLWHIHMSRQYLKCELNKTFINPWARSLVWNLWKDNGNFVVLVCCSAAN